MKVDAPELVKQMQAVSQSLADKEDLDDLAELIGTWAVAVEELAEKKAEAETEQPMKDAINQAVSTARSFHPTD